MEDGDEASSESPARESSKKENGQSQGLQSLEAWQVRGSD